MITKKIYVVLTLTALTFVTTYASDYVLYSPDTHRGGDVGPNGAWEVTDECAASHDFLKQEE